MTAINADSSERFSLVLKLFLMMRTKIQSLSSAVFESIFATNVERPAYKFQTERWVPS